MKLNPGLWGWTAAHPGWKPGQGWDEQVWSYFVETETATALVDPLLPRDDADSCLETLDREIERAGRPVQILLTCSHHRRSADELAARYDASIWDGDGELPAGVGTFRVEHPTPVERPLWFAEQRALAFGDALTLHHGDLRVWWDVRWPDGKAWYDEHLLPSLRPLAELPVEHVLLGHGGLVPGPELAAALERPPYS